MSAPPRPIDSRPGPVQRGSSIDRLLQAFAVAVALLLVGLRLATAQEFDPQDMENRTDYAYFTEDPQTLRSLIREARSTLAKGNADAIARYELGFAHYRLGLLLASKEPPAAAGAMSECIDELGEATDMDARFAEAFALQSACHGQLAALRTVTAMINGPRSGARLEKALKLAPANPRVALLDALSDYDRPKAFGGDKVRALTKLRRAAELFDQAQQAESAIPGWGHADAQAALGRSLFEAGDLLGARNALERALIIAPEYSAARRLLARVTAAR